MVRARFQVIGYKMLVVQGYAEAEAELQLMKRVKVRKFFDSTEGQGGK